MISVIVPIYNSERFLEECIESILCQTYRAFELLMVDDGSNDQSRAIVRKWEATDGRVRLLCKENSGASSARNRGLDDAKGEWIVFIDSDDRVKPQYLQNLYNLIVGQKQVVLGICSYTIYHNGRYANEHLFENSIIPIDNYQKLFIDNALHRHGFPWGKIYNREIIERGKIRFDEQVCIAEDLMFMMRYLIATIHVSNANIAFSDSCTYDYMIRNGSLSTNSSPFENEYYSLNEYRNTIRLLVETFGIDKETNEILSVPLAYYMDRCLNSIFQKVEQENRLEKLEMLNRIEYKKYKKCNTLYESFLKFLFVHKFWRLYSYLRK